jgi:hypothetical protein
MSIHAWTHEKQIQTIQIQGEEDLQHMSRSDRMTAKGQTTTGISAIRANANQIMH